MKNYILMALARLSPSLRFKNWLYRRMGIDVGPHASIGLEVTMDIFFPELITIGEDSIVGFDSVILCHEFLVDEYRTGPVEIGEGVSIGAKTTILPGVTIHDGATVSANSLVNRDVPEGAFYGGVPARDLEKPENEAFGASEEEKPGNDREKHL